MSGLSHDAVEEAGQQIMTVLRAGGRVAVLLDYDGTLREIESDPSAVAPTLEMAPLLEALGRHPRIDVTIISGRTPDDLERFVGAYPYALIAEHGATARRQHLREWEHFDRDVDYSWKDKIRAVLRTYAEATPESFVEEKRTSLVWHYRRSDPELGEQTARQLAAELTAFAESRSFVVRHGKKIVEVTPVEVNKGAAILRVLQERPSCYELVVVAGDDLTDESMFCVNVPNLVSIKVGDGDTSARFRVPDPSALRHLLKRSIEDVK